MVSQVGLGGCIPLPYTTREEQRRRSPPAEAIRQTPGGAPGQLNTDRQPRVSHLMVPPYHDDLEFRYAGCTDERPFLFGDHAL
jgi:hypothetical protein